MHLTDEEVSRRTMAISMKAGKLTARGLAYALRAVGRKIAKERRKQQTPHGRQRVKKLMAHGTATNSIEVEAPKVFDRVARKWNVDYAFYQTGPDKYLLFFKTAQADAMTACFSEYSRKLLDQSKSKRVPIREQLKRAAEHLANVPSAMHDIQVTNCEIYDCGRSGINFLNPWGRRQVKGNKWQYVNEGILPWHPYTNFYMANNIIHNIDGDGLIVDNVQNAVVEKNLCYNTAVHLGTMGAAVGFFNWNSDDTYFQYNEVFNVGKDATKQDGSGTPYKLSPGDAQGIEIDALNDRTWVQHNYVHDNRGGFMMWCNLAKYYPSYDGIIRYNISENDHMESHGIFHSFSEQYGSETYNNAFFLNPDTALKDGKVYMFHNTGSATPHKMYNNIFYLDGDTAYPANTFDDGHYDWRSNIFYNFTNLPQNDDLANPNIAR